MRPPGTAAEVLRAFLMLGFTSFGGPVAHIGYFQREFVDRRQWLQAGDFASLLAMCQFLPGPASSQLGFCLGLRRAGWLGGLAAWVGFTLPSAVRMLAIAHWIGLFQSFPLTRGVIHGLQLAAVAVVAQAVWVMARSLCPDTPRRALALLSAAMLVAVPNTGGQVLILLIGAVIGGLALEAPKQAVAEPVRLAALSQRRAGTACLAVFLVLLVFSFVGPEGGGMAVFTAFYRAGALVFGGGHVVLPTLRDAVVVPGWVAPPVFLAGYGAAQAMPGPLFTVAAFLGTVSSVGPGGVVGGVIALAGIFLPGLLVAGGVLPYWRILERRADAAAVLMGVNAAVVGLLGAAFITLLSLTAGQNFWDGPIILAALALLTWGGVRPALVVLFCAVAGAVF